MLQITKLKSWPLVMGQKLQPNLKFVTLLLTQIHVFLYHASTVRKQLVAASTHYSGTRKTLRKINQVKVKFCYRELNNVVAYMVKMGSKMQSNEEKLFDDIHPNFEHLLFSDLTFCYSRWTTNICNVVLVLK